ncbi:hypothetical protein [Emticicia fontis]
MRKIIGILISIAVMSCSTKNNYYAKEKVELLKTISDGNYVSIYYTVPKEASYYSPGVDYEYNKTGNYIDVKVVREDLNTTPNPMIRSSFIKKATDSYLVKVPVEATWKLKDLPSEMVKISN